MVLLFLILGVVIFSIAVSRGYMPALPRIKEQSQLYKKVLDTGRTFLFKNSLIEQYGGFRKYINEKVPYKAGAFPVSSRKDSIKYGLVPFKADTNFRSFSKFPTGIRAAFYVDWDAQSFLSLQQNISKMNLVIPEWIFIDPTADTVYTNIDDRALGVMKKSGVKIMPILSNNYKEVFRGDAIHRIINDPVKKARLIKDVAHILEKYDFVGVNVDFEELQEKRNEKLVEFQKDIYERLHSLNYLVTQDVMPFNEDYNFKELAKYNDYIFLMAYDQHSDNSGPGPISDQKWIEGAVDDAVKKIPTQKLILCMAAYGYDWKMGGNGVSAKTISYQEALVTAKDEEAIIDFDNNSYNLHFDYEDDDNIKHQVQFNDAATAFNTLRFATEYGLAGTSIWRLGSEDARIWSFYDRDMNKPAIRDFDFAAFSKVDAMGEADFVDYEGTGEVLDIIATPTNGRITPQLDTSEMLISEETYDSLPSKFVARKYGTDDSMKLVLTFDDGPDPNYTPKILDILSRYHVPATFFLVGINAENNIPLVKREFREGHEIGNHTFTHPNIAKVSQRRAILEMESTRLLIECITGHSTIMFRAPYNADFEPEKWEELIPVAIARKKNYLDIGESIDPLDWEPGTPADSIYDRVVRRKDDMTKAGLSGNIILLHDAGGEDRTATVEALPRIIEHFQARGFHFTTVADILGKTKDELMPPVPKGSGYYLLQINYYFAELGYWSGHILFSLFIVFMILSIGRVLLLAFIATREYFREKKTNLHPFWSPDGNDAPLVSIIVPAYNEEVNAVSSVRSLLTREYPNVEIIFVDDGSTDNTYEKVNEAFAGNPKVKVFSKPNGGKASALNFGINQSEAEYVVCIDADTKLKPDAVSRLMEHFAPRQQVDPSGNPRPSSVAAPLEGSVVDPEFPGRGIVGAVAGNVKVGNQVNTLTRWQSIEYISSQNFDRKAFAYLNAITVVPGAIGAFRKAAIEEAGGFTTDTLAEDCDLTIRILRCGYIIENDNRAIAMTEAPETLKMFFKQRFRWSYGVMQTFWKNRDALFNWKYNWLGWVALPNILIFQYIIPFVIPLADFFMIVGLLTGNASKIAGYYLVFMLVDLAVALLAFSFEKERLSKLVWLIPQRLVWRWLMWYVLFRAVRRAFKGELQHWGVLKRTGNVTPVEQL